MAKKVHIDDATLRQLMHQLSHDLRNPLAAIVTNLEFAKRMLAEVQVDPDLAESIEDSVTACDVLRRIVANFDLLVRGAQLTVAPEQVEVAAVAEDVIRRCRTRSEQANLAVELIDDSSGTKALLDRATFALALENLLANSLQHAPRGSTVRVAVETTDDQLHVVVHDQGGAIPVELQEKAFGAEGNSAAGRCQGSRYGRGLGLLAARAAAAACGAELVVEGEDKDCRLALVFAGATE